MKYDIEDRGKGSSVRTDYLENVNREIQKTVKALHTKGVRKASDITEEDRKDAMEKIKALPLNIFNTRNKITEDELLNLLVTNKVYVHPPALYISSHENSDHFVEVLENTCILHHTAPRAGAKSRMTFSYKNLDQILNVTEHIIQDIRKITNRVDDATCR